MRALVFVAVVMLAGCKQEEVCAWNRDVPLFRETFKECMASLPAGPKSTVYNDWDEIVSECKDYSRILAHRYECVSTEQAQAHRREATP